MTKYQTVLTVFIMGSSFVLFAVLNALVIVRAMRKKRIPEKNYKEGVSTALAFSGALLLSIWLLRFAVGYYSIVSSESDIAVLTPPEELFNSLFKTLKTFSIDEGYSEYVKRIKEMVSGVFQGPNRRTDIIQSLTIAYASIMDLFAPFAGGAIILEILASTFPKIGLRWSYFFVKRPKYYFNELTAASLSLAKSIYSKEKAEKPIFIFTDAYVEDNEENDYELLMEAKRYGAICIRDDLAHIKKTKCGKRTFFLIGENEFENLQVLMKLSEKSNVKYITESQIYLFVQSDAYIQVEKEINKQFKKEDGKEPTIIPVNSYRNLVQNLFMDVPLFEPLIGKEDKTKLNITIFGNGNIGTEAFLNAYWLGQMMVSGEKDEKKTMTECQMIINVVSKDKAEDFWSKIDYVNPEIKKSVELLGESTAPDNDLLCYNASGDKNKPYCSVRYINADVKVGTFWNSNPEATQTFLDSDYIIVALGSDADNISVADKLRRAIGKKHIENPDCVNNTVIAYAVFNSDVAEKLNGNKFQQTEEKKKLIFTWLPSAVWKACTVTIIFTCPNISCWQKQ